MLDGLIIPGKVCYAQRELARLSFTMAGAAIVDGRTADAENHLRNAFDLLKQYSGNPDNTMRGTWLRNGEKYVSFDDLGDDCIIGAYTKLEKLQAHICREYDMLPAFDKHGTTLPEIWNRIITE